MILMCKFPAQVNPGCLLNMTAQCLREAQQLPACAMPQPTLPSNSCLPQLFRTGADGGSLKPASSTSDVKG